MLLVKYVVTYRECLQRILIDTNIYFLSFPCDTMVNYHAVLYASWTICNFKVDYKVALHRDSTPKISVAESNFVSKTVNTTLNHFESTYLVLDIAILNLTRIDFPPRITNLNVLVNILDFLC